MAIRLTGFSGKIADMLHSGYMSTVTIPKMKYETLKREAAAYRKIASAGGVNLFDSPPTRDTKKVIAAMKETGRYSKKFLSSLSKGLARSSFFNK